VTDVAVAETPASGSSTSIIEASEEKPASPFGLLVGTIIRPLATFKQLSEARRGYWWFVFVVTVITIIAATAASAGVTARAFQNFTAPAGAATGGTRVSQQTSPLVLIALPVASGIAVTLLDYGLRAVAVFLASLLLGGKTAFKQIFTMAAWTTLPNAVRRIVQAIAMIATGGLAVPGLSAAMTTLEARSLPILSLLLGSVDFYMLWSALLLGIGSAVVGKLSKGKAIITVFVYLGLALAGILIYFAISSALGGLLGGGTRTGAGGAGGAGGGNGGGGFRVTQPAN
jgi:hypothetical protein